MRIRKTVKYKGLHYPCIYVLVKTEVVPIKMNGR